MSGSTYERELKKKLQEEGWLVIRSAGSFVCDLVALNPRNHMLIEVKSNKAGNVNLGHDNKSKAQFDSLNELAKKGFNVSYAIRWKGFKGQKWEFHQLPLEPYPIFKIKKEVK